MGSFQKNRYWEKFLDYCSKALLVGTVLIVCLWMISGAKGAETNKILEIKSQDQMVEILFEKEIQPSDVQGGFERNFLQLTLVNATAFPAKSLEVGQEVLEKVYAYQYEPHAVRARIYLTGDLNSLKPAISWKTQGKALRIIFDPAKVREKSKVPDTGLAKAVVRDQVVSSSSTNDRNAPLTADEESLLKSLAERAQTKESPAPSPTKAAAEPVNKPSNEDLYSGMRQETRAEAKRTNSTTLDFGKVLLNLALVLGIIGAIAWCFRKFVLKKGLGLGKASDSMRVLNTLTLAPGKEILVVKVADEFLVLGSSSSGIQLITTLDRASGVERYFGGKAKTTDFAELLDDEIEEEPKAKATPTTNTSPAPSFSVRDTIKSRVRGFKQLT